MHYHAHVLCNLVYIWCMLAVGIGACAGICDAISEHEGERVRKWTNAMTNRLY
jgi:hypothetical protein